MSISEEREFKNSFTHSIELLGSRRGNGPCTQTLYKDLLFMPRDRRHVTGHILCDSSCSLKCSLIMYGERRHMAVMRTGRSEKEGSRGGTRKYLGCSTNREPGSFPTLDFGHFVDTGKLVYKFFICSCETHIFFNSPLLVLQHCLSG